MLYETWCEMCRSKKEREMNETEKNEVGNKKKTKNNMEDDVEIYRYIGETSRSTNERGSEHKKDLEHKRPRSHLLRHCVEIHENEDPDKIEFGMRMISSHRSALEFSLYSSNGENNDFSCDSNGRMVA